MPMDSERMEIVKVIIARRDRARHASPLLPVIT